MPSLKTALAVAASAAAAVASSAQVNVYYGQNGAAALSDVCATGVDYVTLAFVNVSPENDGTAGYAGDNFGAHCWAGWYDGSGLLEYCPSIVNGLADCRSQGTKILLSIGGIYSSASNYTVSTDANAEAFADFLWGTFGPYDAAYDGPRPFDVTDAVTGDVQHNYVDGFDLDVEELFADQGPWNTLVTSLRSKYAAAEGEGDFLITAAPQCPFSDSGFQMGDIISTSKFDALWIQFYNNPVCDAVSGGFNYDAWVSYLAGSPNANTPLFIGLPGSVDAADSGYVEPAALATLLATYSTHANFGGVMLWNEYWAQQNVILTSSGSQNYLGYVQSIVSPVVPTSTSTSATSTSTSASTKSTSTSTSTTRTTATSTSTSLSSSSSTSSPSSLPSSSSTSTSSSLSTSTLFSSTSTSISTSTPTSTPTSSLASISSTSSSYANSTVSSTSTVPTSVSASSSTTVSYTETDTDSDWSVSTTVTYKTVASSSFPTSSAQGNFTYSISISPIRSVPVSSVLATSVPVSSPAPTSTGFSTDSGLGSSSSSDFDYTTSTVQTTVTSTILSCAPTVTNCPYGQVTTVVVDLYTTICPITATEGEKTATASAASTTSTASTAPAVLTASVSTIYSTLYETITSCAPAVTNCPVRVSSTVVAVGTTTVSVAVPSFKAKTAAVPSASTAVIASAPIVASSATPVVSVVTIPVVPASVPVLAAVFSKPYGNATFSTAATAAATGSPSKPSAGLNTVVAPAASAGKTGSTGSSTSASSPVSTLPVTVVTGGASSLSSSMSLAALLVAGMMVFM